MGVAIRALFGVERDYNAHTVRMDRSGNITRSCRNITPTRATNKTSESQISASSSSSSVLLLDAVLAASALLGAADGLPDPLRPACYCAPMIWF